MGEDASSVMKTEGILKLKSLSAPGLFWEGIVVRCLLPLILLVGCLKPSPSPVVPITTATTPVPAEAKPVVEEGATPRPVFALSIQQVEHRSKLNLSEAVEVDGKKHWSFMNDSVTMTIVGRSDSEIEEITIGARLGTTPDVDQVLCFGAACNVFDNKDLLKEFLLWFKDKPTPPATKTIDGMDVEYALEKGTTVLKFKPAA